MSLAVMMPALHTCIEVPAEMPEDERAELFQELGKIAAEIARLQARHEERTRSIEDRIVRLETGADASGRQDLALVQKALDKREAQLAEGRRWVYSVIATLLTSAIVGLVVHYLSRGAP
jgi:hypothetical protein